MRQANDTGKLQLPPEPRHGCDTLPLIALTIILCQKHGLVKFISNADVPDNSAQNKKQRGRTTLCVVKILLSHSRSFEVIENGAIR